jgi:luciferase-like monooxygenase
LRFSIFVSMERLTPGDDMNAVAKHALDLVKLAEEGGFEIAWAAEHHSIELIIGPNICALFRTGLPSRRTEFSEHSACSIEQSSTIRIMGLRSRRQHDVQAQLASNVKTLAHKNALVSGLDAATCLLIANCCVETLVLGHRLVRVEADLAIAAPRGFLLGEAEQPPT